MKLVYLCTLAALFSPSLALADSEINASVVPSGYLGVRELVTEYPDPKYQDPTKSIVLGQSFTVPADTQDSVLTSVSFWLYAASGTPKLRAYIGEMSSYATDAVPRLVGAPLFASEPVEINWHAAKELKFDTGTLALKPGKSYIAFITGISDKDLLGDKTYVLMAGREVPDETNVIKTGRGLTSVVGNNAQMQLSSVSELFGSTSPYWNGEAKFGGGDFAFSAKFITAPTVSADTTTPPSTTSQTTTDSSKTQGNASDSGGGGGCTLGTSNPFDPVLLVLSGIALFRLTRARSNVIQIKA